MIWLKVPASFSDGGVGKEKRVRGEGGVCSLLTALLHQIIVFSLYCEGLMYWTTVTRE